MTNGGDAGSDARQSIVLWDSQWYMMSCIRAKVCPLTVARCVFFGTPSTTEGPLGEGIVARMFGNDDVPFGVVLTSGNIESHLANIREYSEGRTACDMVTKRAR